MPPSNSLSGTQIDHIEIVTNARGAVFEQVNFGPDPYAFVSTALVSNNQLQISVKRQRTGTIFDAKKRAPSLPEPPSVELDAVINAILQDIERRFQLKPAE